MVMVFTLLVSGLSPCLFAQSADDARFIEVRRAQISLNEARAELARQQRLQEDKVGLGRDLDMARLSVERAQLNYQSAVLSLQYGKCSLCFLSAMGVEYED